MKHVLTTVAVAGLFATLGGAASAADISACLITKTDSNPFFAKMREGVRTAVRNSSTVAAA